MFYNIGSSNTMSISYLVSDIGDVYENFVVKIVSDLLVPVL